MTKSYFAETPWIHKCRRSQLLLVIFIMNLTDTGKTLAPLLQLTSDLLQVRNSIVAFLSSFDLPELASLTTLPAQYLY